MHSTSYSPVSPIHLVLWLLCVCVVVTGLALPAAAGLTGSGTDNTSDDIAIPAPAADRSRQLVAPSTRTFVADSTFAIDWTLRGREADESADSEANGTTIPSSPLSPRPAGSTPTNSTHWG